MTAINFDTLKFSRKLESAGIPREHAISIAEAVAEVQQDSIGELATKSELMSAKTELKNDIVQLEQRMTIKIGTMLFMLGGVLIAVKFLGH
jgi:hypothetical protein